MMTLVSRLIRCRLFSPLPVGFQSFWGSQRAFSLWRHALAARTKWFLLSVLVCLAACGQVAAPPTVISPSAATDVDAILPAYTGWSRLTDEPRNVSGYIWSLCRLPLPEEEAFVESQHGGFYLSLYANQTAYPVIMQETDRVFPVGSIIVKEKLASPETTLPVALGIMVKHQPGFNTPSGDWEYLYRTSDGTLFSGIEQTQPCQSCHITQTGGDSVYYPYSILGRG